MHRHEASREAGDEGADGEKQHSELGQDLGGDREGTGGEVGFGGAPDARAADAQATQPSQAAKRKGEGSADVHGFRFVPPSWWFLATIRAGCPMKAVEELAGSIDHTLLSATAVREDIRRVCREAMRERFAAVCVNPLWVPEAAAMLAGSPVAVATVVGFPLGASAGEAKVAEARLAVGDGAREIDMVISLGLLKSGEDEAVRIEIAAVADVVHESGGLLKVIVETCYLSEDEKRRAVSLASCSGADFVKTSTGFGHGGATIEDVALLRRFAPPGVGVKASGGIKTFGHARAMLAAGANRLGTSSGVAIVTEARRWYESR